MDASSILSAMESLRTATDIVKTFAKLNSLAEMQSKTIELQSAILAAQGSALAAQSEQAAMLQQVRELEEKITKMKAWEETKKRYKLTQVEYVSTPIYALKVECKDSEPPHWICQQCYEDGRKSVLALNENLGMHGTTITCPHCQSKIITRYAGLQPTYAP